MNDIAPGWYKDPAEPATQRYWDGEGWLGDPLPIEATPPSGPPPSAPAPALTLPPPEAPQAAATPPVAAPPPGSVPPVTAPPPGAPLPPGPAFPPGSAWPPRVMPPGTMPPGPVPPGAMPPGMVPPGAPPGTIPWPIGVPVPPGYRMARPFVVAVPRPHGLPVAPLGRRLVARLIDIAIVLGLNVVATGWLVYLFLRDYLPFAQAVVNNSSHVPALPGRASELGWVIPIVAMVVWLAYEVPALAASGQTIGKRTVGIKVMPLESTNPLGFGRALRRWGLLGWPVLLWGCLGLGLIPQFIDSLSPVWGGPLQLALHDRSAQTVVVQCGRRGQEITPISVPGKTGEQS